MQSSVNWKIHLGTCMLCCLLLCIFVFYALLVCGPQRWQLVSIQQVASKHRYIAVVCVHAGEFSVHWCSLIEIAMQVKPSVPSVDSVLWMSLFDPSTVITPGQVSCCVDLQSHACACAQNISLPLTSSQSSMLDLNSAEPIGRNSLYAVSFSITKTKTLVCFRVSMVDVCV